MAADQTRPFSVSIRTDDTEVVGKALHAAGMPKQTEPATRIDEEPKGLTAVTLTVVFEAADAASAEARVREAVGDGPEVGPAEPVGQES